MFWLPLITAGVGLISSMYSSNQQSKYQKQQINAQNEYNARQAAIDAQWYKMQLGYSKELESFSIEQQNFAFKMQAYSQKVYQVALKNAQMEHAYQVEMLNNKKKAASTQYNADVHVANVMKLGAEEQAKNAVGEVLRVGSSNTRQVNKQLVKAEGHLNATLQGGITGGDATTRATVEAFMQRNDAVANLKNDTVKNIIQIANEKNKVVNDFNLKVGQSYRQLQSVLALKAPPMPMIAPPQPVFTGRAPIAPVHPPGATPSQMPTPNSNVLSNITGGIRSGYNMYQIGSSIGSSPTFQNLNFGNYFSSGGLTNYGTWNTQTAQQFLG